MMSYHGFTADEKTGYYDISVFDYQRLLGNTLTTTIISDDDKNKIKIFKGFDIRATQNTKKTKLI